jgi:hypothetical protein
VTAVRRAAIVITVAGGVLAALAGADGASAATRTLAAPDTAAVGGTWGTAQEVPGTASLNKGVNAQVNSVSCASAGNCSAGGFYNDGSLHQQAFVVSKVNGSWHTAIEVPGTAALNKGGGAAVSSVSCASAGNCSAGGSYEDSSRRGQAFVVSEVNGTWHTAIHVPGTAVTSQIGGAGVLSVSCPSAGNCSAGGLYGYVMNNAWRYYAFVVNQVNGSWHTAIQVPGLASLSTGVDAEVSSVSCRSAGNCSASGTYAQKSGALQAFVVNEVNGTWHTAIEVPGTATLNKDGNAWATSVSCASPGNCSAGGHYMDGSGNWQAFVVNEVNGTWHTAIKVPGTATLNTSGYAGVNSVSCRSAGNCSAGGYYRDGTFQNGALHVQAFVVNEVNGTWHTAIEVPGTATLNKGWDTRVLSLSCASAGNCSAGGFYRDSSGREQGFVVSEVSGTWGTAIEVPGTATLNKGGYAQVNSVSCGAAGNCSTGGVYTDSSYHWHAFIVSES